MSKRSRWKVQKTNVMPMIIRDSEFSEILANLGSLMYDEIRSLPDLNKFLASNIATTSVEIASAITRKKVANG